MLGSTNAIRILVYAHVMFVSTATWTCQLDMQIVERELLV